MKIRFLTATAFVTAVTSAAALSVIGSARSAAAEERTVQVSPAAQVSQRIGLSDVTITYSRPGVKGRKIWGELVPMGKVWRTGANSATAIKLEEDMLVEGKPVPAGTYALFTIPGDKTWSVILNREAKQWGAYARKESEDVVRVEVTPRPVATPEDWLAFRFTDLSIDGATVVLSWEKVEVPFRIRNKVDTNSKMLARLREKIASAKPGEWEPYADAADYCLEQKINRDEAMAWVDKALSIKETTMSHYVKAGLLDAAGRTKEGIVELEKALKSAGPDDSKAFLDEIRGWVVSWGKK